MPIKRILTTLALPVSLLWGSYAAAATVEPSDWFGLTTIADASISNGTTNSPTYSLGASGGTGVYLISYFAPTTLEDGQKLTLSYDVTLNLNDTSKRTSMRLGLFQANEPHASTGLYGADRVANQNSANIKTTINDWKGLLLDKGSTASEVRIWRKVTGSPLSTSTSESDGANGNYDPGSAGFNSTFVNGVARSFTWELVRTGNDLTYHLTSGSQVLTYTLENAFVPFGDDPYGFNVFDGLMIYFANNSVGGNPDPTVLINSVELNNVSITLGQIPESSTVMLWLAGAAGVLVFWMRRRR